MDGQCDITPQFADHPPRNTCGLDLQSLLSVTRPSTGMIETIPPNSDGSTAIGTATKLCDGNNNCLFVTADHALEPEGSWSALNMHDADHKTGHFSVLKRDPENDIATFVEDSQRHPTATHPGLKYQPETTSLKPGEPVTWMGFATHNLRDLTVSIGVVTPDKKIDLMTKLKLYLTGESYPSQYTCVQGIGFTGQSGSLMFNASAEYKGVFAFTLKPLLPGKEYACYVNPEPLNKLLKDSFELLKTQRDKTT